MCNYAATLRWVTCHRPGKSSRWEREALMAIGKAASGWCSSIESDVRDNGTIPAARNGWRRTGGVRLSSRMFVIMALPAARNAPRWELKHDSSMFDCLEDPQITVFIHLYQTPEQQIGMGSVTCLPVVTVHTSSLTAQPIAMTVPGTRKWHISPFF